ncbi:hypothetical protein PMIN05_005673 [Paraphaeosphaeria minitans]
MADNKNYDDEPHERTTMQQQKAVNAKKQAKRESGDQTARSRSSSRRARRQRIQKGIEDGKYLKTTSLEALEEADANGELNQMGMFERIGPDSTSMDGPVTHARAMRGEIPMRGTDPNQPYRMEPQEKKSSLDDTDGLKLKVDANLEIEIELKASIRGDLTLSLYAADDAFANIGKSLGKVSSAVGKTAGKLGQTVGSVSKTLGKTTGALAQTATSTVGGLGNQVGGLSKTVGKATKTGSNLTNTVTNTAKNIAKSCMASTRSVGVVLTFDRFVTEYPPFYSSHPSFVSSIRSTMSRIPRPTTESTQDPSSRFGSMKGSMRKGFQSLRETLKKKDAVGPSTDRPQISAPVLEQNAVESGVNTVSVPACLNLPVPPTPSSSRQPVRSIRWESGVQIPTHASTRPGPVPRALPPLPLNMRTPKRDEEVREPNGVDADPQSRPPTAASHLQMLSPTGQEGPKNLETQFLTSAAAPPRLPIRNPKRNSIIVPPSGHVVADQAPVPEALRKLKLRRPGPALREAFVRELPSPPTSEPRSSHSTEREQQVQVATGIESTLDAAKQPAEEDRVGEQSTAAVGGAAVEEASPSGDVKHERAAYSMDAFIGRIQSFTKRLDSIKVKVAQGVEKDESDPVLEARGSGILEQVASLKEAVANARDSKYILSEEDIASIESECQPRASELVDVMVAAQEKIDEIVGEARELAARVEAEQGKKREEEKEKIEEEEKKREEEKEKIEEEEEKREEEQNKPPPDAPRAPKVMLERRAQRAAAAQFQQRQSQSWGRNGPPSSAQRQANSGGHRSANWHPNPRRLYSSQSMPRGGYYNVTPTPPRRHNPQGRAGGNPESEPQGTFSNGAGNGSPAHPARSYETWTMPRGGWPQNHGYNWPQGAPAMNPMWHNSSAPGADAYAPGPPCYFPGYNPYGSFDPMGGYAP